MIKSLSSKIVRPPDPVAAAYALGIENNSNNIIKADYQYEISFGVSMV